MRASPAVSLCLVACGALGCDRTPDRAEPAAVPSPAVDTSPANPASAPNLEVLAVEIAAARACDQLRGHFRPLRANESAPATGTLWIRDCVQTVSGHLVTYAIGGHVWGAATASGTRAGAHSVVAFTFRHAGRMAVTYQPGARSVTVRFEPTQPAVFTVLPRRGQPPDDAIDQAILHSLGAALAVPHGAEPATTEPYDPRLAVVATMSACAPVPQIRFGASASKPTADRRSHPMIELERGGLALFGPIGSTRGTRPTFHVTQGRVRVTALCLEAAQQLANARVEGRPRPAVKPLVTRAIGGSLGIEIPPTVCPVVLAAEPATARRGSTRFTWYLPAAEETGVASLGPLRCAPASTAPTMSAP